MKMKKLHPPRGLFARFWLRLVRFVRRLVEGPEPVIKPVPLLPPRPRPGRAARRRIPPAQAAMREAETLILEAPPELREEWSGEGGKRPNREAERETLKMAAVPEDLRVLAAQLVQSHFHQTGQAPAEVVIAEEGTSLPVLPHDLASKTLLLSREAVEQAVRARMEEK